MQTQLHYEEPTSDEVQELISHVPSWIIRWGISLFFGLFVLLGAFTWVIHYPDIVKAPLTLTTADAPKIVSTKVAGRLTRLLVHDGSVVKENDILGYIESTAKPEEVLQLSDNLDRLSPQVSQGILGNLSALGQSNQLGEVQPAFQNFNQQYVNLEAYMAGGYYQKKKNLMANELADMSRLKNQLLDQQNLYNKDYSYATKEYQTQKTLAKQGVIAPLEMNREESKYLNKQLPMKQIEQNLVNLNTQRINKEKEIVELDKQLFEIRRQVQQSFFTLKSAIETWKASYIIRAYTHGRVSFSQVLQEKQMLTAGQELLVIAPTNTPVIGVLRVPQLNFGKIKQGQKVQIRFNGYPAEEYGWVEGNITHIAEVPAKDSSFLAQVSLPQGLATTTHKNLRYKNGMNAQAEIITEDLRLAERFLHELRRMF